KLHWVAVDGEYSTYLGGTLPLFSPCGVCLDRGRAELFSRPERVFPYFSELRPEIVEALVIPMIAGGRDVGTIWIASHVDGPGFTSSDLAIMTTLGNFTAAALTLIDRARAARDGAGRELADPERADVLNRQKDEFLSTISHELRTPLHAILSWSELLIEGLSPDDAQEAAFSINRNAERQMHLVDDLLDSSRLLSRAAPPEPRPVHIGEMVSAVVETSRLGIAAKALTLRTSYGAAPAIVMGDSARLQQAVANILGNAVKFASYGGTVRIAVNCERDLVIIDIADDGEGMSPEFLSRAFERFTQADSSYARRQGGLGLGLAIASDIVAAHGGSIEAQSAGSGRGSTFTLTLPLSPAEAPVIQPPSATPAVSLAGLRIVVVDDEADALEALAIVLRHRGAIVETAGSVPQALDILTSRPPDLLLTDIGMPHTDGYQLLARIRGHSDPRVNRIPAIAVTAHSAKTDRDRIRQVGFDALVVKPVPARELVQAVASLLKIR
ncbi:MAG: ATP-binding protein, partial [Nitrospiria bacterium]